MWIEGGVRDRGQNEGKTDRWLGESVSGRVCEWWMENGGSDVEYGGGRESRNTEKE